MVVGSVQVSSVNGDVVTHSGFEIGRDGPSVVLVGFDGSETSWRALYYALGLGRRNYGEVVVVHAEKNHTLAVFPAMTMMDDGPGSWTEQLRQEVRSAAAHHPGVCVSFIVGSGDPVRILQEQATKRKADAVVLGASRRSGHRLAGSIAVRAVRMFTMPVTVVP
jgi:nucleotide-binding universal stress UspA family protein